MNEKKYCPECGHEFEQGEYDYNYETSNTDYECPECGWCGTHNDVVDTDKVMMDLEDSKEDYELGGVELTEEDAESVIDLLADGVNYDDALDDVLRNIRICLDNGLE